MSAPAEPAGPPACLVCGGRTVPGTLGAGILSSPRFVFSIGAVEVNVAVASTMCEDCGEVRLRATDPAKLRSARAATAPGGDRQAPPMRGVRRAAETYRLLGAARHAMEEEGK